MKLIKDIYNFIILLQYRYFCDLVLLLDLLFEINATLLGKVFVGGGRFFIQAETVPYNHAKLSMLYLCFCKFMEMLHVVFFHMKFYNMQAV
jgi:hypothetical protein